MNSWKWRTVITCWALGVVLFGASSFFFGEQQNIDNLPTGTEVIGQAYEENPQVTEDVEKAKDLEVSSASNQSLTSEEDRIKSELALVGIKSEGSATNDLRSKEDASKNDTSKNDTSINGKAKTIKDFPSPVQGVLIKSAGNYYSESLQAYLFHAGTDYAQAEGAVIRVKHSGKVTYAGPDPILGQKVELDCGEDWSVIYGGLENLRVKEGDQVEVNQAIGQVGYYPGADGVKERPQLHFEVWHGDEVQVPSS